MSILGCTYVLLRRVVPRPLLWILLVVILLAAAVVGTYFITMFAYHGDKFHESKRLPVFNTKAELEASPWAKYLKLVYGELPAETLGDDDHMNYPLDLNSTAILYHDKLEAAGIDDIGEPKAISLAGHDKDLLKRCP